jgi:pilus assembly protein Flp/PilA
MKDLLIKLSVKMDLLKDAVKGEEGQDLIEYALLIAFVAFAVTAGMRSLAGSINTAFAKIGTNLTATIA